MKALFINYAHPDIKHISGVRLRRFAEEMANFGHQIVLLTSTEGAESLEVENPGAVMTRMGAHDWSKPFHIACKADTSRILRGVRNGKLPRPVRIPVIAYSYVFRSGMFWDWVENTKAFWPIFAKKFDPDMVFPTFGNIDSLYVAKKIAGIAGCPWVMDIKDSLEIFIPLIFHGIVRHRFKNVSGITLNAKMRQNESIKWFANGKMPKVIYSGIENNLSKQYLCPNKNACRISFIGSFIPEYMVDFLKILNEWIKTHKSKNILLRYAGAMAILFKKLVEENCTEFGESNLDIQNYLKGNAFEAYCSKADINAYIWDQKTFHHKTLELFSRGRPVLTYPGETEEAKQLAIDAGAELICCTSKKGLLAAFDDIFSRKSETLHRLDTQKLKRFTWENQARELEKHITRVINSCSRRVGPGRGT